MLKKALIEYTIVITVCVTGLLGYMMYSTFQPDFTNHANNWDRFYADTISARRFYVPREAIIIEATEEGEFMGGEKILVRFKLPNTKTPKQWMKIMAEKSQMTSLRETDYDYYRTETNRSMDIRSLRYIPSDEVYEIRLEWR